MRPGCIASMASSTPRVTSSVFASGNFSITSRRPSPPPPTTASPISGWCPPRRSRRRRGGGCFDVLETDLGQVGRRADRQEVLTPSRWFGVSMNPPVPGVDASTKLSGETQSALPAVSSDLQQRDVLDRGGARDRPAPGAGGRAGPRSTRWRRPERPSGGARSSSAPAPTSRSATRPSTRARPSSPGSSTRAAGASAAASRRAAARAPASAAPPRPAAREDRSVPGSKTSRIRDRPATDSERMSSRKATPTSRSCSIGTVISCSTSAADSPRASVWISTVGGANSGRTSTGISRSCAAPTASRPAARATIRSLNLRLMPTIERIMVGDLPARTNPPCRGFRAANDLEDEPG